MNLFNLFGGLLMFVGTFLMISSYEEFTNDKKLSSKYMIASLAVFILGAILLSFNF